MRSLLRHLIKRRHGNRDSGVAVAVALMTGFMLLVATSGLVAKQMMTRRASASESYKQLAELAAGNGATSGGSSLLFCLVSSRTTIWYVPLSMCIGVFMSQACAACSKGDCHREA